METADRRLRNGCRAYHIMNKRAILIFFHKDFPKCWNFYFSQIEAQLHTYENFKQHFNIL